MQFAVELWILKMSPFGQCIDMSKKGMNHDIIGRPKLACASSYYSCYIRMIYTTQTP